MNLSPTPLPRSLTPAGEKLDSAWAQVQDACGRRGYSWQNLRGDNEREMIALIRDQIFAFNDRDTAKVVEIARALASDESANAELKKRVKDLATYLSTLPKDQCYFNLLPLHIRMLPVAFVPPTQRFGIHCSNQYFRRQASDPKYLASLVNNPSNFMRLTSLAILLKKCGNLVTDLDFSRLIPDQDRSKLNKAQLEALIKLCPNLEKLTLYHAIVSGEELLEIVMLAPKITHVNVANCVSVQSLQALQQANPLIQVAFVPYFSDFDELIISGVTVSQYFEKDAQKRTYVDKKFKEIAALCGQGMPFNLFCTLSEEKRDLFLKEWAWFKKLTQRDLNCIKASTLVSCNDLTLIFENIECIREIERVIPLLRFFKLSFEAKQLLIEYAYSDIRLIMKGFEYCSMQEWNALSIEELEKCIHKNLS